MKTGTKVTWIEPLNEAEKTEVWEVVEDRGDRVLMRLVCDLPIPPTTVAQVAELKETK